MKYLFTLILTCFLFTSQTIIAQCPLGDIELLSQSDVDNFVANYPNCTHINGYLEIQGNSINDITGLDNIENIDSFLAITFTSLTNLDGLLNLSSIGDFLIIFNNLDLTELAGLNNLASISGNLNINTNASLTNLNGLNNLSSIGGYLVIGNNNSLISIDALNTIGSIDGFIGIYYNNSLSSLSGLQNISSTSMDSVYIQNNPNLSICEVQSICDYLSIPSNPANISNNSTGCNSRTEVENACINPLPVELLNFNAETKNSNIHLTWQTASEINNQGFQLQKSNDGISWQELIFVEGNGTASTQQNYNYMDSHPFFGMNYYRLKQVDYDGVFEYSNVVSVRLQNDLNELRIYPNPVSDYLNIQVPNSTNYQKNILMIIDINGNTLLKKEFISQGFQIDLRSISSGIYLIQINDFYFERFLKQ